MKKYFLFGSAAVNARYFLGKDEKLSDRLSNISYLVYVWDETTLPEELLLTFNGWGDFCEISEELYNELLEL